MYPGTTQKVIVKTIRCRSCRDEVLDYEVDKDLKTEEHELGANRVFPNEQYNSLDQLESKVTNVGM